MSDHRNRDLERLLSETDLSHRSRVRQTLRRDLLNQLEKRTVEKKRNFTVITAFSVSVLALMIVIFAALVLSRGGGLSPAGPGTPTATPEPYNNATVTAMAGLPGEPTPTPAPNLLIFENADFCFAYPDIFVINTHNGLPSIWKDEGEEGELFYFRVDASEAQGRRAEDGAAEVLAANTWDQTQVVKSLIFLGGEVALMYDTMPGQDPNRMVFIVHNDTLLTLTFSPEPAYQARRDSDGMMQWLFDTVTATWLWASSGLPCDQSTANSLMLTPTIVPVATDGPVTATPSPTPTIPPLSDSDMENYTAIIRQYSGIDDMEVVFQHFRQPFDSATFGYSAHFLAADETASFTIDLATENMVEFSLGNWPLPPGETKSEEELQTQACEYMQTYAQGFEQYADDLRFEVVDSIDSVMVFHWSLPMPYAWEGSTLPQPYARLTLEKDGIVSHYVNTLFYLLRDGLEYPEPEPGDNGCG